MEDSVCEHSTRRLEMLMASWVLSSRPCTYSLQLRLVTEPYDAQVDPASPAMLAELGAGQLTLVS